MHFTQSVCCAWPCDVHVAGMIITERSYNEGVVQNTEDQ